MKRLAALAAAVVAIAAAAPAWAAKVFVLDNVTLEGGGTLTGSFTTNDALTSLESVDITSSMNPAGPFTFQSFHYNDAALANWVVLPSQGIQNSVNGAAQQLRLDFFPLTETGAVLLGSSNEYQFTAGRRVVTGGQVVAAAVSAVPEPATWAMMIVGFGLDGSALRQGGRKGARAAA